MLIITSSRLLSVNSLERTQVLRLLLCAITLSGLDWGTNRPELWSIWIGIALKRLCPIYCLWEVEGHAPYYCVLTLALLLARLLLFWGFLPCFFAPGYRQNRERHRWPDSISLPVSLIAVYKIKGAIKINWLLFSKREVFQMWRPLSVGHPNVFMHVFRKCLTAEQVGWCYL